jgi:hypothetical protein
MAGFGPAHAAPLIDPKECLPHFKNGVTAGYGELISTAWVCIAMTSKSGALAR